MKTSTNGRRVSKESVAKIPMRNRFVCGCALAINGAATTTPSMTISLRRFFIVSLEFTQYARLFQRMVGQSFANKVVAKAGECRSISRRARCNPAPISRAGAVLLKRYAAASYSYRNASVSKAQTRQRRLLKPPGERDARNGIADSSIMPRVAASADEQSLPS